VFFLGKVLEALGCVDVLFGLYVGMTDPHGMAQEFKITAIGILVFAIGYFAEWFSGEKS
jgi:hypothetical protein